MLIDDDLNIYDLWLSIDLLVGWQDKYVVDISISCLTNYRSNDL